MKLVILVVLLIVAINGNPLHRSCKCKAVSHKLHATYHSWDVSSCWGCSCADPAVANCEQACRTFVQSYALTGCGKTLKGASVKASWDAGSCSTAISQEEYKCS